MDDSKLTKNGDTTSWLWTTETQSGCQQKDYYEYNYE